MYVHTVKSLLKHIFVHETYFFARNIFLCAENAHKLLSQIQLYNVCKLHKNFQASTGLIMPGLDMYMYTEAKEVPEREHFAF